MAITKLRFKVFSYARKPITKIKKILMKYTFILNIILSENCVFSTFNVNPLRMKHLDHFIIMWAIVI